MPNRQFQPKSNRAAICITETVSRQRVSATYIGQRAKRTRALPATHPPRLSGRGRAGRRRARPAQKVCARRLPQILAASSAAARAQVGELEQGTTGIELLHDGAHVALADLQVALSDGTALLLEPRVLECSLDGDPPLDAEADHVADEVLGLGRDVVVLGEAVVALDDRLVRLHVALAQKGVVAKEHDEGDEADAPHVDRLAVALALAAVALHQLRSQVVVRAADRLEQLGAVLHEAAESEVCDEDVRVRGLVAQQDVLGLEVPVHHALVVHELDRLQDGLHVPPHFILCVHVILLGDAVHELAAPRELADEDEVGRRLVSLLHADDVRVAERAQHLKLAHHRGVVLAVLLEPLVEDLGREILARLPVAHELHLGEVATTDRLALLIRAPEHLVRGHLVGLLVLRSHAASQIYI
mmetsp:Transcript_17869/g.38621  ORF Transcript_17869/g.38621 Transcript_17869/m.38621 type:complete len:414 (+) Transcript_17869:757-1998(+)